MAGYLVVRQVEMMSCDCPNAVLEGYFSSLENACIFAARAYKKYNSMCQYPCRIRAGKDEDRSYYWFCPKGTVAMTFTGDLYDFVVLKLIPMDDVIDAEPVAESKTEHDTLDHHNYNSSDTETKVESEEDTEWNVYTPKELGKHNRDLFIKHK